MSSSTREELLRQFTEIEEKLIHINSERERLDRRKSWYLARKENLRAQLESMICESSGTPLTSESILDKPIETLKLQKQTVKALNGKEIFKIRDLINRTEKQLLCIPKIATVSILKIKDALLLVGQSLLQTESTVHTQ